jgi:hypothetical protein
LDGDVSGNSTESAPRRLGRVVAFIFGIAILFEAAKASVGVALVAPAWLERISPGTAARVAAQQAGSPSPINAFTLIFGGMILIGFAGSFFGTAGWGGTMLLIFAIRGRWIGESPPVAIEPEPA